MKINFNGTKAAIYYLVLEARVISKLPIDGLEKLGHIIWIATGESSGHDVPVHRYGLDMILRQAQLLKQVVPSAHDIWRSERYNRKQA